jgi:hypothetical protein
LRAKKTLAQSTLEYAFIIAVVVAALLAMLIYLKRSAEGRLRQLADELGPQYAPGMTVGKTTLGYNSTTLTEVDSLSEAELNKKYNRPFDLDGNGKFNEDTVYGTESTSYLGLGEVIKDVKGKVTGFKEPSETRQSSHETVDEFEKTLF